MTKNSVCYASYLRNHTLYDYHLWYTFVKWYLQAFLLFFQNFYFLGCYGVKNAKNGPKWQKILSVTCSMSKEPYIMTVIYVCKMIISSGGFSIFLNILIFWVYKGGRGGGLKEQKMVQNAKKLSVPLHIPRNCTP